MRREVGHLPEQAGVEKDQMACVIGAQVTVPARCRHEESRPARKSVMDSCDRVDGPSIKRKQKQVLESRRQVPAQERLVVDAVTRDGRVVTKALGDDGEGGDVFVLNAGAVVPEGGG